MRLILSALLLLVLTNFIAQPAVAAEDPKIWYRIDPENNGPTGDPSGKIEFIIPQTNMEVVADMLCTDPAEPVSYQ